MRSIYPQTSQMILQRLDGNTLSRLLINILDKKRHKQNYQQTHFKSTAIIELVPWEKDGPILSLTPSKIKVIEKIINTETSKFCCR